MKDETDLKPMQVIEREILETLRSNAYDLNNWLALVGETNPDKALTAYIKLLEMNNKLADLKNNGVNGEINIDILVSNEDKQDVSDFLKPDK